LEINKRVLVALGTLIQQLLRHKPTWESLHLGPEEKEEITAETRIVTTWPKAKEPEHIRKDNTAAAPHCCGNAHVIDRVVGKLSRKSKH
jgi:hypothetical protein